MKSIFFLTCFLFSINAILASAEEKPVLVKPNVLERKPKPGLKKNLRDRAKLVQGLPLVECLQKASECEKEACAPPVDIDNCHTYTYIHVCKKIRESCKSTPVKK